ncbi:MAG: cytochrome c3 family protein, partial [Pirellulaceae bacterium]|nr:cytochrome c3 family protein [Pirellulaceae bacterium]
PKKSRDFDCKSCHVDGQKGGAYGSVTRSLTFERACASCHEQSIRAASVEGWAVVQLPSIGAAAATPGSGLEHWPSTARFGFEGTISPVMRGLLLADANVTTVLQQLPNNGNLVDISTISTEREQAAIALALATERLIDETARDGQQAWLKRLERITREKLGRPLSDNERALLVAMCAGLPPDVFRQVQQAWFEQASPSAAAKVANAPQTTNSNKANHSSNANNPPGAATQLDSLTGEMSDSLLATPLSGDSDLLSASGSDLSGSGELGSATLGSDVLGSEGDLLAGANTELNELGQSTARPAAQAERAPTIKGVTHAVAGGWYVDHETLAIRYMPGGHADATLAAWSMWWTLMTREDAQPVTGQTDRLVRVVGGVEADEKSVAAHIPGGCVQCHSLQPAQFSPEVGARAGLLVKHVAQDAMASNSFTSNSFTSNATNTNYILSSQAARSLAESWRVPTRARTDKEFTKFNHTPHLALPAINDCRYCHKLNDNKANLAGPTGTSVPGTGRLVSTWQLSDLQVRQTHSEFSAMHLGQCTACHRPGGANDGCLQCHNYHINAH